MVPVLRDREEGIDTCIRFVSTGEGEEGGEGEGEGEKGERMRGKEEEEGRRV